MAFPVFLQGGIQGQLFGAKQQRRHVLQRLTQGDAGVNAKQRKVVFATRAKGYDAEGVDR